MSLSNEMQDCAYLVKWNTPLAVTRMELLQNEVISEPMVKLYNMYVKEINRYIEYDFGGIYGNSKIKILNLEKTSI